MNKSEIETFKDMKRFVKSNTETLIRIDKALNGDKEKDKYDMGLMGDVRNNMKWKHNVNKALSLFGITTLGLLLKEGFNFYKRG